MRNSLAFKLDKKSHWLALMLAGAMAALTAQSCSVDKSKYTFDDGKFAGVSGMGDPNGGASGANGGGAHAGNPNGGDGDAGDGSMNGGNAGNGSNGCTVGEHACTPDGHLQTCQAGEPPAFDEGKACGEGLCSASHAACLACVPGEFQCASNVLRQCDITGSAFQDTQTCDSKATCVASGQKGYCVRCKAGQNSCENTDVHVLASADDGALYSANHVLTCNVDGSGTDTAAVCEADTPVCDPAKKCLSCSPNQLFCDGQNLNLCNADGMGWTGKAHCVPGTVCDGAQGKCVVEQGCPSGVFSCVGATLQHCSHGRFTTIDTCDSAALCDQNAGRCQACTPNTSSCVNNNVLACDFNNGQATPYTPQYCAPTTCTPNGNTANCNYCQQGKIVCYDGSTSYSNCTVNGLQQQPCPKDGAGNQTVCSSALQKCVTCVPGRASCDATGVLKVCNADGNGYTSKECGDQNKCDAGRAQCIDARPGDFFCTAEGDLMSVGYGAGHIITSTLVEKCGSSNQCNAYDGACNPKRCVPGQLTCAGADVYACDGTSDRRQRTGTRCSSAARCQDGFGCVKVLGLAAGDAHTCAIVAGPDAVEGDPGYALCWGANESGQLGNGSPLLSDSKEPRQVLVNNAAPAAPRLANYFTDVCAGKNFTCADITPGDGTFVVCWGSNAKGQLGVAIPDPGPFNGPFDGVKLDPGQNEKPLDLHSVTCGAEFACALGPNGGAWCWGANEDGQLGSGNTTNGIAPALVNGHVFLQLSAGAHHVCGVEADNSVWCWGDGSFGQLGNTTKKDALVPVLVGKVAAVADRPLALGNDFTLALGTKASKNPFAWGSNAFGQLANETYDDAPAAVGVTGLLTADFLNAGTLYAGSTSEHACARLGDRLFCWGANVFGEVGDGTTDDRSSPVSIFDGKTDATKLAPGNHSVAVGGRHTCALTAKGDVLCWGANHRAQLGTTQISPQRAPVKAY
jgi:alpha-tubulin suppressor-like RCC1 family protein